MWLLYLTEVARATIYDVTVCGEVDIDLIGDSAGAGDNWTDDTDDKPARGFKYELWQKVLGTYVIDESGYVSDSGGDLGCVTVELDNAHQYEFLFYSEALVDGNTILAHDNDTNQDPDIITVFTNYTPTVNVTMYPVLPGSTDDRWNHLAMAAFALYFENAGLTSELFRLYSDQGPCCSTSGNTNNNFTLGHELGHAVATKVNGGNSPAKSCGSTFDGCDGGGDSGSGNDHGTVTKEYYSCAIVEGMGDWYSAITWNDISTSATDCEYQRGHDIDFDLDTVDDYDGDVDPYPCTGDPMTLVGWLDDDDWLNDAITQGAGSCTNPEQDRSTQFDFVRYLFAMRTEEDLTMTQIWTVWDDAEPHTWDVNGGAGVDDPEARWEAAASGLGTAHGDQEDHGMDHY